MGYNPNLHYQPLSFSLKYPASSMTINYIQNNYDGANKNNCGQITIQHPIDRIVQLHEENKRLNEENKKLYEALLKEKDEKIALLQKMLEKK